MDTIVIKNLIKWNVFVILFTYNGYLTKALSSGHVFNILWIKLISNQNIESVLSL